MPVHLDEAIDRAFEQAFLRILEQTVQAKMEECFRKYLSERIHAKVEECFKRSSEQGGVPNLLDLYIERWFQNNLD